MKRLHLRTPRLFDYSAGADLVKPRAKFYCISEGPTEESYFYGVRNNKRKLEIKNDILIEIVKKDEGQESYSHPEQLVNACLYAMGRIDEEGNELSEEKWAENCKWDYDPAIDYACVIFDRDYRGLEKYLPDLLERCKKHNIFIAISNPNFELWLLMHFPGIEEYEKEVLLSNPKNLHQKLFPGYSKNKKYLEIVLSVELEGYRKGESINFEKFVEGVPLAQKQAALFCEEPELLCDELGSSVGKLIERMQE